MDLKHLSDEGLLESTLNAVQAERDSTAVVLHHLREMDKRRLYSKLKCKNLKDYAVRYLKYSDGEAWMRIAAMQLLKELPEIEEKINDGSLSMTNLAMVKRAFGQEATLASVSDKIEIQTDLLQSSQIEAQPRSRSQSQPGKPAVRSKDQKLELIEMLENVSKREALKIVERETGVKVEATESVRDLADGQVEMKTVVTKETEELIRNLKGLLAHSHPNLSSGDLLNMALRALKEKLEPSKKPKSTFPEKRQSVKKAASAQNAKVQQRKATDQNKHSSRYIPAEIRKAVWQRDEAKCTNCSSSFALQFEHVVPFAKGGETSVENIKLLCRHCNQRSAIESFGQAKMSLYLRAPVIAYSA